MIETVQERQRGGYDFSNYYDNLCALKDLCPVPAVKAHLPEGVLDINGDRIKANDWEPIINTLRINRNLDFVAIRSYFHLDVDEKSSNKRASVLRSKIPAVRSADVTAGISRALRESLLVTECLTSLELEGLPLRPRDIRLIAKGLSDNKTLSHLSLEGCRIGDKGMETLCKDLKHAGNIATVNLSACGLGPSSGELIASLLKFQCTRRHNEAWKESLRYRRPNLDSMSGLRRLTLNQNPLIGDEGASHLSEALKDDLWVKAVDLQDTGISNPGARALLAVLKYNATLVVLDLRRNPLLDRDLLRAVTEQVLINGDGKETEFRWLRADGAPRHHHDIPPIHAASKASMRTKPLEESNRPAFKPGGVAVVRPASAGRAPVDAALITPRKSNPYGEVPNVVLSKTGQPWRTAARASRYKGYPPDHTPGRTNVEENSEELYTPRNYDDDEGDYYDESEDDLEDRKSSYRSSENNRRPSRRSYPRSAVQKPRVEDALVEDLVEEFDARPTSPVTLKGLKNELVNFQRKMHKEVVARKQAEDKIIELLIENQHLKTRLEDSTYPLGERSSTRHRTPVVHEDETRLESIEQTFKQFHNFLDMLRDAGLGRVITAAGLDKFTGQPSSSGSHHRDREPLFPTTPSTKPRSSHSQGYQVTSNGNGSVSHKEQQRHQIPIGFEDKESPYPDPSYPGYPNANYQPSNQESYPPSNQSAYPPSNQPGYPLSNQPGYPPSNQPGYPPNNQPGYPPSNQPGYPPSNQPCYPPSNQPGYPPSDQTGYPPSDQTGYPPSNQASSVCPFSNQGAPQQQQPSNTKVRNTLHSRSRDDIDSFGDRPRERSEVTSRSRPEPIVEALEIPGGPTGDSTNVLVIGDDDEDEVEINKGADPEMLPVEHDSRPRTRRGRDEPPRGRQPMAMEPPMTSYKPSHVTRSYDNDPAMRSEEYDETSRTQTEADRLYAQLKTATESVIRTDTKLAKDNYVFSPTPSSVPHSRARTAGVGGPRGTMDVVDQSWEKTETRRDSEEDEDLNTAARNGTLPGYKTEIRRGHIADGEVDQSTDWVSESLLSTNRTPSPVKGGSPHHRRGKPSPDQRSDRTSPESTHRRGKTPPSDAPKIVTVNIGGVTRSSEVYTLDSFEDEDDYRAEPIDSISAVKPRDTSTPMDPQEISEHLDIEEIDDF